MQHFVAGFNAGILEALEGDLSMRVAEVVKRRLGNRPSRLQHCTGWRRESLGGKIDELPSLENL